MGCRASAWSGGLDRRTVRRGDHGEDGGDQEDTGDHHGTDCDRPDTPM